MSSRDTMLAAIRTAVASGNGSAAGSGTPAPVPRDYARTGVLTDHEQVLELLVDRLVDYKALVTRTDRAGLPAALDEALAPVRSLVVPAGLPAELHDACRARDRHVAVDGEPDVLTADQLDQLDAVVTGARVAIALTGTIVLDAGPDQGRRALSLVPDRHLIVLFADQVVETVPEGLARLEPTAPLTMISGPSATSDIELSRVEGVHGPRTLHVLLVAG
jgi:L-lactate dehydrogenase complex protein LldG